MKRWLSNLLIVLVVLLIMYSAATTKISHLRMHDTGGILELSEKLATAEALLAEKDITIQTKEEKLSAARTRIANLIEYSAQVAALDPIDTLMSPADIQDLLGLIPHGNPFQDTWAVTSRFDADRGYGGNPRRGHTGMDIVPRGASSWMITPIADGTVVDIGIGKWEGKWIVIEHNSLIRTKVMHLEKIFYTALPGEEVTPETNIGIMGATGYADGAHLHIEIQVFDGQHWIPIDPLPFLEGLVN